jgi:tRNA(fMet)-specific endonuclease VapC
MSLYILDTDLVSLLRGGHSLVVDRVRSHSSDQIAVTVITVEELFGGWISLLRQHRSPIAQADIYDRIASTFNAVKAFEILSFTEPAIGRYRLLKTLKLNAGAYDLRIAAIALDYTAIVVTRNVRDFSRIPGVQVEDWSR